MGHDQGAVASRKGTSVGLAASWRLFLALICRGETPNGGRLGTLEAIHDLSKASGKDSPPRDPPFPCRIKNNSPVDKSFISNSYRGIGLTTRNWGIAARTFSELCSV